MIQREITTHHSNLLNDSLEVTSLDRPGPGGANRHYHIGLAMSAIDCRRPEIMRTVCLTFQEGNPADGINGISNEALLAVLIDRFEGFQRGPFACGRNSVVLESLNHAMAVIKARTAERQERGVEGQQTP